ncbi:hypothetical protein ACIBG7_17175 [Nonomuraea sp. NPDC050328]|uniref:hypothetical protein n=1 Tax=Nonomuraea sp. NPDC050328 TaxID=3364361 RepID=UPI0037BC9428
MTDYPTQQTGQPAERTKQAAREVAGEAGFQTRRVVGRLRERAGREADSQAQRAAHGIRQWADDLSTMAESSKPDSPINRVTHQIAGGGRRAADYLEQQGFSGAMQDLQQFARRRPALFVLGAIAAGFLAGRAAKAGAELQREERAPRPQPGEGYAQSGQSGQEEARDQADQVRRDTY